MNYYLNAFNEMLRKRQENQMGRGGGQMMGGGGNERMTSPFDTMSNAEKAAYYSNNPTMAAITQGLQKGFGATSYGMLQNALAPNFVAEQASVARGIDPGTGLQVGGYGSQPGTSGITPTGLYGDQFAGETAPQSRGMFESFLNSVLPSSSVSLGPPAPVETKEATPTARSAAESGYLGLDTGAGVGYGGGVDAPGANADGYGGGDAGFGGNSQAFNQGGMVTPERLMGRAPAPDDGYGALQGGEYVITKAAVERYGKAMMDAINNGTFR
jgi:hypothetical protein